MRLTTIETVIPPGCTVSCPPTVSRSLAVTVTVVLEPDASVPEDGDSVRPPIRPCDSVIDQFTGPFDAVRVRVAELPTLSRIDVGLTLSVPGAGGGGGAEDEDEDEDGGVVLADAAGEFAPMVTPDDGWGVGASLGDAGALLVAERDALGGPEPEPEPEPDEPEPGEPGPDEPGPDEPVPDGPALADAFPGRASGSAPAMPATSALPAWTTAGTSR